MTDLSFFIIALSVLSTGSCFTEIPYNSGLYQQSDLELERKTFPTLNRHRPKDFADSVTSFSWTLFQGAKLPNSLGNLILSPISIQFLLAALEIAAEGETKVQLRNVIGTSGTQEIKRALTASCTSCAKLHSANGIFLDSSNRLNRTYAEILRRVGSDIIPLDFRRADVTKIIINEWASNATQGYINQILSPSYDIANTEIIIASAIYFRSMWEFKFKNIGLKLFETIPERGDQVEFMEAKKQFRFKPIDLGDNYVGSMIEIPYKQSEYSMIIIMPDDNVPLDTFIRRLNVSTFSDALKTLSESSPKHMTLRMPKFRIKTQFSLVNSLLKMNLVDLFTINSRLPYLGLLNEQKVNDILQQAVIIVDEEGTVASAVGAAVLVPLSANREELMLNVDKPFISVIFDKINNIPLFISKIFTPTQ